MELSCNVGADDVLDAYPCRLDLACLFVTLLAHVGLHVSCLRLRWLAFHTLLQVQGLQVAHRVNQLCVVAWAIHGRVSSSLSQHKYPTPTTFQRPNKTTLTSSNCAISLLCCLTFALSFCCTIRSRDIDSFSCTLSLLMSDAAGAILSKCAYFKLLIVVVQL